MERMSVVEQYKQNLASQPDFNLFDGFKLIDFNKKGIVGPSEFNTFLAIDDFAISKTFKYKIVLLICLDFRIS